MSYFGAIPGRQGPPGETGPTGPMGPSGQTIVTSAVNQVMGKDGGTHKVTWEGPWKENKVSVITYIKTDNHVVIDIESVKDISVKSSFIQSSKLPPHLIPKIEKEIVVPLFESMRIMGLAKITPEGHIIYSNSLGNPFLNGLNVGWNNHTLNYLV